MFSSLSALSIIFSLLAPFLALSPQPPSTFTLVLCAECVARKYNYLLSVIGLSPRYTIYYLRASQLLSMKSRSSKRPQREKNTCAYLKHSDDDFDTTTLLNMQACRWLVCRWPRLSEGLWRGRSPSAESLRSSRVNMLSSPLCPTEAQASCVPWIIEDAHQNSSQSLVVYEPEHVVVEIVSSRSRRHELKEL